MSVARRGANAIHGPREMFMGDVWLEIAASVSQPPQGLRVLKVHFTPGARTAWHSHPAGQVLHVLDGVGRVQEKEGPLEEIRPGDTVTTHPDVWHWHGAAPNRLMVHVAINEGDDDHDVVHWLDPVTDEEYHSTPATA